MALVWPKEGGLPVGLVQSTLTRGNIPRYLFRGSKMGKGFNVTSSKREQREKKVKNPLSSVWTGLQNQVTHSTTTRLFLYGSG